MAGREDRRWSAASGNPENSDGNGGYNAGMMVFSYIIGGIVVWSLIGWLLDILLATRWFVLVGAIVGLIGGLYLSFARRFRAAHNDGAAEQPPGSGGQGSEQE